MMMLKSARLYLVRLFNASIIAAWTYLDLEDDGTPSDCSLKLTIYLIPSDNDVLSIAIEVSHNYIIYLS